jgi:hypothetical protein
LLTPISIRINHMQAQTPFYAGFLLPDDHYAIYITEGLVSLVPVVPSMYADLYAQDGPNTVIAYVPYVRDMPDEALCSAIITRLKRMSAFELLTEHFDEEESLYLVINDRSDEGYEEPEYDEYGRQSSGGDEL